RSAVSRDDHGVVPWKAESGEGEAHRRDRRVDLEPIGTEPLAQHPHHAEEPGIAGSKHAYGARLVRDGGGAIGEIAGEDRGAGNGGRPFLEMAGAADVEIGR